MITLLASDILQYCRSICLCVPTTLQSFITLTTPDASSTHSYYNQLFACLHQFICVQQYILEVPMQCMVTFELIGKSDWTILNRWFILFAWNWWLWKISVQKSQIFIWNSSLYILCLCKHKFWWLFRQEQKIENRVQVRGWFQSWPKISWQINKGGDTWEVKLVWDYL